MKNYYVEVPFAGVIGVSVQARDDEHAKELAIEACSEVTLDYSNDNLTTGAIEETEWDIYEKLVDGNVCYPYHREISITCEDE